MTIKFNDIMKNFYDDETLGIKNEDAPANSVAGGGVSMPPDAVVKKKKKNLYDGRRKEAKAFFKRIEALRAKRDKTFREKEQNIFLWRERIAETENIPPNHVFQEKHISFLANSFSNEHPKLRSKLLKIIGDSKYVEEFIVKFL